MSQRGGLQDTIFLGFIQLLNFMKRCHGQPTETDFLCFLSDPVVTDTLEEVNRVEEEKPVRPLVEWMFCCGTGCIWPVKQLAKLLIHFVIISDGTEEIVWRSSVSDCVFVSFYIFTNLTLV